MLLPHSQDDVTELCRSVAMDPSAYKRFDLFLPVADVVAGPPAPCAATTIEKVVPEEKASVEKASVVPQAPPPPAPAPAFVQRYEMPKELAALASVHRRTTEGPTLLPVVSAVGGCGITTVLATLGRALSILGERVLLVDPQGPAMLDLFYGSRGETPGLLISTDASSQFEGQVHVLRAQSESRTQTFSTKFHRAMAELSGRLDRVLIAGTDSLDSGSSPCLVVLTPELRSVVAAPAVLRSLGAEADVWFVINRFNEAAPSHHEMRGRLKSQLGARLLPFCIPESAFVQDALMKGISVLDMAPQSGIADAFFDLAEWYRAQCAMESVPACRFEETQLAVSN